MKFSLLKILNQFTRFLLPKPLHERVRRLAIDVYYHFTMSSSKTWYNCASIYITTLNGMKGLEVGGPSWLYKTKIPIYRYIRELDNVNWSSVTANNPIMEDGLGNYNWYLLRRGRNVIAEADEIPVEDSKYDFVISAQVLEHLANPIKTLLEWNRITCDGGYLICEVPRKDKTFDYKRPITQFDHLLEDFENNIGHDDLTHVDEVVELKDDFREPSYSTKEELRQICLDNLNNRLMHHHVFDLEVLSAIIVKAGYQIVHAATIDSGHIVLAKK